MLGKRTTLVAEPSVLTAFSRGLETSRTIETHRIGRFFGGLSGGKSRTVAGESLRVEGKEG